MSLTYYNQQLIKYVAENDLANARIWAKHSLAEDKTKKNQWFVNQYMRKFEALSENPNEFEIPSHIKKFLNTDSELPLFVPERYYLSSREKALFEEIDTMRIVSNELADMGINYLNTTLLYGVSGTGKTMFGRYVANQFNLPFFYLNFSQLIESYLGNTSRNLYAVFQFVKTIPCVFMIDEIDSISLTRGAGENGGTGGEMSRITITLMQELDKFTNHQIVIAATNRIDMLDKAVLRRFVRHHEVKQLNATERNELVVKYLDQLPLEYNLQNVRQFCESEAVSSMPQSEIIDNVVRSIAHTVQQKNSTVRLEIPHRWTSSKTSGKTNR